MIVEATLLSTAHSAVIDLTVERQPETTADVSRAQASSTDELRRLMDLAVRYAHRLVSVADPPPGVLLLVHPGDLDVIMLDGSDFDVREIPRLLAWRRPSSAALVVTAEDALGGPDGLVLVIGETSDGLRNERRLRVRACRRMRRLTRLLDRDAKDALQAAPRLFPPRAAHSA
jgi:hypothetical protein